MGTIKMIKIQIATDGEEIAESFTTQKVSMLEVGVTLLRLKQIEQQLIDMDFDDDVNITEHTKVDDEDDEDSDPMDEDYHG
jgi:hypothetical protein